MSNSLPDSNRRYVLEASIRGNFTAAGEKNATAYWIKYLNQNI